MNLNLTDPATKYIRGEAARRCYRELVPALLWAREVSGATSYFWGLFRKSRTSMRESWGLYFYGREQRPKEWMLSVSGLVLSVSPEMRARLDGKTLDFVNGSLQEM
jgi:hypothetical protein